MMMRTDQKIRLFLVVVILAWFAWSRCHAQMVAINPAVSPQPNPYANHAYVIPGKIAVEWQFVDAPRVWLSICSVGGAEWTKEGYHPGFTVLLSQYKPVVKHLPSGQYEITFTAEITKNLP